MSKKYKVIYADPPWEYKDKKVGNFLINKGKGKTKQLVNSTASSKYKTLSLSKIKSLDIDSVADKDCVLFMWVTAPFLECGFEVLRSWGFKYKTVITWRKVMSMGMGYWFRGQCEFLLVAKRGRVKAFRCQRANFLQLKALRHSEKPEEFRQLIKLAVKELGPKLELFSRKKVEGWSSWGDEVESDVEINFKEHV